METKNRTAITVQTTVNAPVAKVWEAWTKPEHITKWTNASDDWHAPYADNDLRQDGKFKTTMAAKDGSMSFDFEGVYTAVETHQFIAYVMADGRTVKISFTDNGDTTAIVETFDAEETNPIEMQQGGWQSILNNFKKYTETNL
ncbi:SRPBCC family protein [Pedobacter sp. Hv1]|uniref:SRPBCC family protein n=1 Tax=Pedobacter sp. Hv1 TaxID=1740090 RepID=UPI0006D8A68D|nr:SRPBCC family protein [Pedobacter sp. Hv1]KQC02198.1 polyketide cyclase [Pedobacter sp. Hv1]